MCILQIRRWCAVLLLPLGLAACGYDGAELIPPGLRATLAAEDRAARPAGQPEKPISVDEMLSRARTGGKASASQIETAPQTATKPENTPAVAASDVAAAPPALEPRAMRPNVELASAPAAPAAGPGGMHPLWAQMVAERKPGAAASPQVAASGALPPATAVTAPPKPAPAPLDARTLVLHFAAAETDLAAEERRRLDSAVALYKSNSTAAKITAGPSADRAAFEQVLFAERRARSVESALPTEIKPTRTFSPEIDTNTVRVEFQTTTH